jgi:replicative DNA helicase
MTDLTLEAGLPANTDAERTILGAVMLDSNAFVDAAEKLGPEDFSLDSHRRIFLRMATLAENSQAIDICTLANELGRNKEIEIIGGTAYLCSLTEGLPRRPVIEEYIRIVKDRSVSRSLMGICSMAIARAADQSETGLEIAAWTDSAIETLIETGIGVSDADSGAGKAALDAIEDYRRRRETQTEETIPYGMALELDRMTGGMFPGEMTVIGGESGVGKSSAMIQAIMRACRENNPAVCYSLEMTARQIIGRMSAILASVPYRFIRFPKTGNPAQAADIEAAAYRIGEWPLHIYDRASMTIGEICASAKVHIRRRGARLICVDYLQRISVPGQREVRLQMSQAAMKLSQAVKGTPAHLMLLSQLKRREDNGFPQMKDLRESGQIENEAHCIALLWREYDKERGYHLTDGRIIVPKNRFGFSGMVNTTFNTDSATFE